MALRPDTGLQRILCKILLLVCYKRSLIGLNIAHIVSMLFSKLYAVGIGREILYSTYNASLHTCVCTDTYFFTILTYRHVQW